ncbi:MAG: phage holin family protein [Acidothermaceae bacterium]
MSTQDYDIGALARGASASVAHGGATGQGHAHGGSESNGNGHKRERVFPTSPLGERSLGELVATLSRDVALLVHQEIELIKADLLATALKLAVGATGFVIALVGLLLAVPVLSIAAALGIHALGISLGFSFLIVGGAYVLIALIAAAFGMAALRKAKPPKRAVDSVKADLHAIARKPKPLPPIA